ncbi:MAG: peptidylprolyl isomerase [Gemmatimonadota bacterium]
MKDSPARLLRPGATLAMFVALAAGVPPARAQEPPAQPAAVLPDSVGLVDQIVAIVGDTTILRSEVEEELIRLRAQGVQIPPEGTSAYDAAFRDVLSGMVDRTILLVYAKRMPEVAVNDDDVERLVEERYQQVRAQFPSDEALMQEVERAGMNMFQYRQMLRAQAKADMLLDRFRRSLTVSGELPPATVSEREIQDYFAQFAGAETRPATVSFDQIVLDPEPSPEADSLAIEKARKALGEVLDGADFQVAARRYSEDEGTRPQGGDLGWLRRNEVVPAFGDAAWLAPLGRPIGPVKTRFGYHIIKVENVRGGERSLRHILVRPTITPQDIQRARVRAEALADSLRAGEDALKIAERHDLKEDEVRFDNVLMDQLLNRFGPEVARRLAQPTPGAVSGPFETRGPGGGTNFTILKVRDYRTEGQYELEDVRENIRTRLLQDKQFARYLEKLRGETYVELLVAR